MRIAVVILNWNGKNLLQQFLPSVIENSPKDSVYVVDNASDDDSIEFVETNFASVTIIQNASNGGFAKGYNDALKQIDTEIYCLLNNDVEVSKDWLEPIMTLFSQEQNTAIVQPKILDYNKKDYFEYAGAGGGFIDKFGFPYCRGRIFQSIEKDRAQYDDTINIFWATGACFFIRKKSFEQLHGFDESFFAHMEEIDLCWRAFNRGNDIKYVGESYVYHVGGATLSNTNPKKTFLNFRNSLYMLTKNLPHGKLFPLLVIRLFQDGLAGLKFLFDGQPLHLFAVLRSHIVYFIHLRTLLKSRKEQEMRTDYFGKKSIVWSYFVNKKRSFDGL